MVSKLHGIPTKSYASWVQVIVLTYTMGQAGYNALRPACGFDGTGRWLTGGTHPEYEGTLSAVIDWKLASIQDWIFIRRCLT